MFGANRSPKLHPRNLSPCQTCGYRVWVEGWQTQLQCPGQQGRASNSWGRQEVLLVAVPLFLPELWEEEPLAMQRLL